MGKKKPVIKSDVAPLLTADEYALCSKIVAMDVDESKRAAALIKLHDGETQRTVAEQTLLSVSQIGYLLRRFRDKGMAIFAKVLQNPTTESPAPVEPPAEKTPKKKKSKTRASKSDTKKGKKSKKQKTKKKGKKDKDKKSKKNKEKKKLKK